MTDENIIHNKYFEDPLPVVNAIPSHHGDKFFLYSPSYFAGAYKGNHKNYSRTAMRITGKYMGYDIYPDCYRFSIEDEKGFVVRLKIKEIKMANKILKKFKKITNSSSTRGVLVEYIQEKNKVHIRPN